jgi:hypothetical protein
MNLISLELNLGFLILSLYKIKIINSYNFPSSKHDFAWDFFNIVIQTYNTQMIQSIESQEYSKNAVKITLT